jgi:hypothetical protein
MITLFFIFEITVIGVLYIDMLKNRAVSRYLMNISSSKMGYLHVFGHISLHSPLNNSQECGSIEVCLIRFLTFACGDKLEMCSIGPKPATCLICIVGS